MKTKTENIIFVIFALAVVGIIVASFTVAPNIHEARRRQHYAAWCKAFVTNLTFEEWLILRESRTLPTSINK